MKSFTIQGYEIFYGEEGEHKFSELPKEICEEMCERHDNGSGYSLDSRYTYSIKGHSKYKGIPLGTSTVLIQTLLMKRKDFDFREHKVTIIKL